MATDARQELAEAQTALLRALVGGAVIPDGFDARQVRAASDALVRKRARLVAKLWPALEGALGATFAPRFAAYAQRHPLPQIGGVLADGLVFVNEALTRGEATDAIRMERLRAQATLVYRPPWVSRRRWPTIQASWLRQSRRLAVVFSFPGSPILAGSQLRGHDR